MWIYSPCFSPPWAPTWPLCSPHSCSPQLLRSPPQEQDLWEITFLHLVDLSSRSGTAVAVQQAAKRVLSLSGVGFIAMWEKQPPPVRRWDGAVPVHRAWGARHLWADPRMDTCQRGGVCAWGLLVQWQLSCWRTQVHLLRYFFQQQHLPSSHLLSPVGLWRGEECPAHSCGEQLAPSLQPGEESPQQLHQSNGVCSDSRWFSSSQLNTSRWVVTRCHAEHRALIQPCSVHKEQDKSATAGAGGLGLHPHSAASAGVPAPVGAI